MCCSSTAAKSPMAEILKSQSPQELWKTSLKPEDPLKPKNPFDPKLLLEASDKPVPAAKAPGTGLQIDVTA
jgi:hypothetical protein